MPLTGPQKRYLRGLGHHLDPVVLLGKDGVTDAVVAKVDAELQNHELIKVRVGSEDGVADALAERTRSEVAQTIGHTALLYRRRAKEPEIVLPKK
jgi:RNA-binding protein